MDGGEALLGLVGVMDGGEALLGLVGDMIDATALGGDGIGLRSLGMGGGATLRCSPLRLSGRSPTGGGSGRTGVPGVWF